MIMGFTEVVSRVVFSNVLSHYFGYKGIFLATGLTWFVAGIIGIVRLYLGNGWVSLLWIMSRRLGVRPVFILTELVFYPTFLLLL